MNKSAMTATAQPLPPPPPPTPAPKRSRKTLIAVIIIVVVAAAIVGVYLATRGGVGPSPSVTPTPTSSATATPTPTPTSSASATPTPTSSASVTPTPTPTPTATSGGASVAGASSLQYTVDVTGGSSAGTYKFMAKNIGTSSMMIRVEITSSSGNIVEVINGAQQKAWMYENGAWTEIPSFSSEWSSWSSTMTGYKNNLASWPGYGDWTYTAQDGSTVRIHDITVNPSLADSLFSPS